MHRRERSGVTDELRAAAEAWLADDPDPDTRAELRGAARRGDPDALADRFARPAAVRHRRPAGRARRRPAAHEPGDRAAGRRRPGPLPARHRPDAAERGVVIGFDARHKSDVFAEDTAAVMAGAGIRPTCCRGRCPRRCWPSSITELGAARRRDGDGQPQPAAGQRLQGVPAARARQIVPPVDTEISARIDAVGPLADVPLAAARRPAASSASATRSSSAYLAHVPVVRLVPGADDVRVAYTPLHGVGGDVAAARPSSAAGFPAPAVVGPQQFEPDPDFPTVCRSRTRRSRARMDLLLDLAASVGRRRRPRQRPRRRPPRRRHPDAPTGGWRRAAGRRDRLAARRPRPAPHRRATTGSWSPRSCRRRCSARWPPPPASTTPRRSPASSGSPTTVARPPRAALRVRLRAGPRLPGHPPAARQGRHHRRRAVRRGRGAWPRRDGVTLAGPPRRHRARASAATSPPSARCR